MPPRTPLLLGVTGAPPAPATREWIYAGAELLPIDRLRMALRMEP
jgi:hypothetical protein